jgi:hypothetical protein
MKKLFIIPKEGEILDLYQQGYCAEEIKHMLGLTVSLRMVQRYIKMMGISRSSADAFRNAAKRGRVHWAKKESKIKRLSISPILRYKILERDGFKCVLCNATDRLLEVDHIDFNTRNNNESNLRCLCEFCNFGRRPQTT